MEALLVRLGALVGAALAPTRCRGTLLAAAAAARGATGAAPARRTAGMVLEACRAPAPPSEN
jgi:hypothetical protein